MCGNYLYIYSIINIWIHKDLEIQKLFSHSFCYLVCLENKIVWLIEYSLFFFLSDQTAWIWIINFQEKIQKYILNEILQNTTWFCDDSDGSSLIKNQHFEQYISSYFRCSEITSKCNVRDKIHIHRSKIDSGEIQMSREVTVRVILPIFAGF